MRTGNRVLSVFAVLCLVAFTLAGGCSTHADDPVSVSTFGALRTGEAVPSFAGSSERGIAMYSHTDQKQFIVYLIHDQASVMCLDMECGEIAKPVVALNGHLYGSSDGKLATSWGVKIASQRPWAFANSLIVITDCRGVVLKIYVDAGPDDLTGILRRFDRASVCEPA